MNTTLKATLALGAAGLSLLGMAGGASAQVTTPNLPNLVFSTFKTGLASQPNFTGSAVGVGFDANGGGGKLPDSPNSGTAQSVYEAFNFDSSAAGAFTTLATGTQVQLQVFAANNNVQGGNFDLYATLFAYNPTASATAVPTTGADLFGSPQKIVLGTSNGGYFTNDFTLTGPITAGQSYVLGLTTLTGDTQDFAQIAATTATQNGLSSADQTFSANKLTTIGNDQGSPAGQTVDAGTSVQTNNTLAFRLYAASPQPVPEASTTLGFTLGLGVLGAALLASKRRRTAAK